MKIWNAFASNNSGSYTIVGSFQSVELAAEVAAELQQMATAHSAYLDKPTQGPSPLEEMAAKYGVAATFDEEEWPQYSDDPSVFSIGHQVLVHVDYTSTMPRALGALIYAKGGRVTTELNHAHHPIAAVFTMWFHYEIRRELDIPALLQQLVDELCTTALTLPQAGEFAPAWQMTTAFGEGDLKLGAAFTDLAPAYAAVAAAAAKVGAMCGVKIAEAHGDPFAHLRPCNLPTSVPMVDVVIEDRGERRSDVAKVLTARRWSSAETSHLLLQQLPVVVLETVPLAVGEAVRADLLAAGAVASLRPSPCTKSV